MWLYNKSVEQSVLTWRICIHTPPLFWENCALPKLSLCGCSVPKAKEACNHSLLAFGVPLSLAEISVVTIMLHHFTVQRARHSPPPMECSPTMYIIIFQSGYRVCIHGNLILACFFPAAMTLNGMYFAVWIYDMYGFVANCACVLVWYWNSSRIYMNVLVRV